MEDKRYKWYKTHGTIYDSVTDKDICIVYEHQGEEDLNLVLDALNNYPKTIELLKEARDTIETLASNLNYQSTRWNKEHLQPIEEFLNQIK